jgi:hypothetical protein
MPPKTTDITTAIIPPIILIHAASSGGSMIYKLLQKCFGLQGISEVGHLKKPRSGRFLPLDPIAQLYAENRISSSEMGAVLVRRIHESIAIASHARLRLLIREHSHQYFFTHEPTCIHKGPSFVHQYLDCDSPIILTIRDPFDSWLSYKASNFNGPRDIDEYCKKYHSFMDACDSHESLITIRYEDCVRKLSPTLTEVSKALGIPLVEIGECVSGFSSSGDSGRKSSVISPRARRPYSSQMVRSALASKEYMSLIDRLKYPPVDPKASMGIHKEYGNLLFARVRQHCAAFASRLSKTNQNS